MTEIATDIGEIRARITLDTHKFREGTDRAKRDLSDVSDGAERAKKSIGGLESALISLGASASLVGLVRVVQSLAKEANELQMSMQGLAEVSKALGINIEQTTGLAQELANKGFMSIAEASTAVKTALSSGLNLEQTRELIYATADAAAYNREAHLDWGEAIVQVMRGIKSGNSELTDAAGITTNLSVMYDRYAKSIGTSAANLTEAQKVQAAYNGIMSEAALFAGNADTALQGYAGTQATFNQTLATARAELGDAFLPLLQELLEKLTPLIVNFTKWTTENKSLIAGLAAGTVAVTGLVAVITTLITVMAAARAAAIALNLSLGPIGWAVAAIGLVTTGVVAYGAASSSTSDTVMQFARNQDELNAKLSQSPLKRTAADVQALRVDIESLNGILEKHNALQAEINALQAENQRQEATNATTVANFHRIQALNKELAELNGQLKDLGYDSAESATDAMRRMNEQVEGAIPALIELERAELRDVAAKVQQIDKVNELRRRYDELSSRTELASAEQAELAQIVRQLTEEYPSLSHNVDEHGRYILTNTGLLDDYMQAERNSIAETSNAAKERLSMWRAETVEKLKLARSQMAALSAISAGAAPFKVEEKPTTSRFGLPELKMSWGGLTTEQVESQRKELQNEANQYQLAINEFDKLIADITEGRWNDFLGSSTAATATDNAAKTKAKSPADIQREQYQASLKWIEKQKLLRNMNEADEAAALAKLAERYAKNDDIWIDAESRRQRIVAQIAADEAKQRETAVRDAESAARERFNASAEWIDAEVRRMTEKGASEREIAQMQLDAWTRVRNRYASDTEYYKRADEAMFRARMDLRKEDERAAKAAADTAEKAQRDLTKSVLDNIDKQRKAELDALDERRKATQKYYDDLLRMVDEAERGRERKKIEAEAAKYRDATSAEGRKRYAELTEELRKMDVEDNKRALQQERDDRLDALDRQKRDIDAWYNDLKATVESFSGDFITIYQLTEDARLSAFIETNAAIKAEMTRFVAEMNAINRTLTQSTPASAVDPFKASAIAQMQANSSAWHSAKTAEEKARLAADNQRLGASVGARYDSGLGRWFGADGLPLYHTGGIAGERTFSAGDRLMPDELVAVLKRGETVFTPGQIRDLIGNRGAGTVVNVERVVGIEMHDTVLEDEIDIHALGRTGTDMAAEMVRRNMTGGMGDA